MTPSAPFAPDWRLSRRCRSSTALKVSPLQVRIGIATGLVIVGDLLGAGASQEQAVVGETPNLAARLQARWPSRVPW
jgi:class 3 adenylate cyclase